MCMDAFFATLPLPLAGTQLLAAPAAAPASAEQAIAGTRPPLADPISGVCTGDGAAPASARDDHVPPAPAPPPHPRKRKQRLHYHEFMLRAHQRLHSLQSARPRVLGQTRQGLPVYRFADPERDPLDVVVSEVGCSRTRAPTSSVPQRRGSRRSRRRFYTFTLSHLHTFTLSPGRGHNARAVPRRAPRDGRRRRDDTGQASERACVCMCARVCVYVCAHTHTHTHAKTLTGCLRGYCTTARSWCSRPTARQTSCTRCGLGVKGFVV
jgi:hypothetical protein